MSLVGSLIAGAISGWLAGKLVSGAGFGLVGNIAVGIVGGVIAGWVLPRMGFGTDGGLIRSILQATFGALILLVLVRVFKRA
jgi:uncharacterized membrane protein YeaQ/YmgE (transglycosylase-associated protein family)